MRRRAAADGFEADDAALKIENYPEFAQEISTEDPALQETCSLVQRIEVEYGSIDVFARVWPNRQFRNHHNLHIIGNSGGSEHSHSALLIEALHLVAGRHLL